MSWLVIARQEAWLTATARSVRLLAGLLVLVCAVGAYVFPVFDPGPHTTAHFGGYVSGWLGTLVPLIGLVVGYNAVVGERRSGALALSLSLPHGRRDVVFGKLLGRLAPVVAAIVAGALIAGALVVYPFGELALAPFLAFVGATITLGVVYTALGVAISTFVATKTRATVAAFGVYVLVVVWTELEAAIELALASIGSPGEGVPTAVEVLLALEPTTAYDRIVAGAIDPAGSVGDAWYLDEWVALALLVLWATVPLAIAYRRFAGVDLQ